MHVGFFAVGWWCGWRRGVRVRAEDRTRLEALHRLLGTDPGSLARGDIARAARARRKES